MQKISLTSAGDVSQEANRVPPQNATAQSDGAAVGQSATWYVGQSPPKFGAAHKAVNACSALGFRAWLPQIVAYKHKRVNGRAVWIAGKRAREETVQPLFPGYWFVSFEISQPGWGAILRDENVSRLITRRAEHGVVPVRLPPGFIESMQALGRAGDGALPARLLDGLKTRNWQALEPVADEVEREYVPFPTGTSGRIIDGAFASFHATVKADAGERILVLAEIFGRMTQVELDRGQFEAK